MTKWSSIHLDTKCFERSLIKRRDSGFLTFGELCRYIRRLCQRALLPKHTPADTDWSGLLQLQLDGHATLQPGLLSAVEAEDRH